MAHMSVESAGVLEAAEIVVFLRGPREPAGFRRAFSFNVARCCRVHRRCGYVAVMQKV